MRHLDILDRRFGAGHVLGGQCLFSVTLNERGEIVHLNETHNLSFGERDGARSARVQAIAFVLSSGNFQSRLSEAILEEMLGKWIVIATNAGITCLIRAAVGDIVAGGAADLAIRLLDECTTIATRQGFPPEQSLHRAKPSCFHNRWFWAHGFHVARHRAWRTHRSGPHCWRSPAAR
jgi:2-dehydropantoate 2-reductase